MIPSPVRSTVRLTRSHRHLPLIALCIVIMTSSINSKYNGHHVMSFQIQTSSTKRMTMMNHHRHSHSQSRTIHHSFNYLHRNGNSASSLLFMSPKDYENNNNSNTNDNDMNMTPPSTFLSFNDDPSNDSGSSSSSTIMKDADKDTTTTSASSSTSSSLDQALMEARKLKERAEKERLEAEKMRVELTMAKISSLEQKLNKIGSLEDVTAATIDTDTEGEEKVDMKLVKESQDLKEQIEKLKNQLDVGSILDTPKKTEMTSNVLPSITKDVTDTSSSNVDDSSSSLSSSSMDNLDIPPMPKDVFDKRSNAFKTFPKEIKEIYSKAVNASEDDDIDTIVQKLYILEQTNKKKKEAEKAALGDMDNEDDEEEKVEITLLDIANAQAGYYTLPPQIQEMINEQVGMRNERNATVIVERLLELNKIRPTGEFGGVEFAMGDPDEDLEEQEKKSRGKDREFTEAEVKSAIDLFENLPLPMKSMLTSSLEADSSNSTAVIEEMIEQKKILPSKDGVEFVVFGNENDDLIADSMELLENDNYVRSMLPPVTRKDGNTPSKEVADAFFSEVLGRNTFNPISKPEPIPGGYIIRGENTLKSNDALVTAMEEALAKSSIAGKVQPYLIRDPTSITEEQFETNTFELPVVLITGTDLTPETNRLVKPLVTLLGGVCVASFSLAVCFGNEGAMKDPVWLEQMSSPLVISILGTQIAHEAAHQIVAFKDKVCI